MLGTENRALYNCGRAIPSGNATACVVGAKERSSAGGQRILADECSDRSFSSVEKSSAGPRRPTRVAVCVTGAPAGI